MRGGHATGAGNSVAMDAVLAFAVSTEPADDSDFHLPPKPEGAIGELMNGAAEYIGHLCRALAAAPHMHLYIDYGHTGPVIGDTLQAVTGHRYAHPLAAPGQYDLSAQVDFAQIAAAATQAGLTPHGPVTQAEFLGRLGAATRLERLAAGKDLRTIDELQSGLNRLMDPSGMGGRFKAMALASPGLAVPPVF